MSENQISSVLSTPPEYYIQDPERCDDEKAILLHESITEYVGELIDDGTIGEFYRHLTESSDLSVSDVEDVINGHSEAVVVHVLEKFEDSGFDQDCVSPHTRWIVGDNGPYHYWISYKNPTGKTYHFDPACPWGVSDYRHLPKIKTRLNFVQKKTESKQLDPRADPNLLITGFYQIKSD